MTCNAATTSLKIRYLRRPTFLIDTSASPIRRGLRPIYPTLRRTLSFPTSRLTGLTSWLHQAPLPYNIFITSTCLHPAFKTSFAVHSTETSMCNAYGTSRVMTPPGLSTIWTGCVDESPSVTRSLSRRRFSTFSDLPASLRGSVCANSGGCAARCGSFRHPTRSHLTS